MKFVVFWNINWLKHRLRQHPLTRREILTYIGCWLALLGLSFLFEDQADDISYHWTLIISDWALLFLGIYYAWICNNRTDGKHFWSRLIALSWVLTMRIMVLGLPFFLILALAPTVQSNIIHEIAATLLEFLFIWRLGFHFRELNQNGHKYPST